MNIKETILNVLMVLSLLLAVAMTIWYVFSDSPTITQLIFGVVVPFALFTFSTYERLNNKIERNQRGIYQTRETFQKELGKVNLNFQKDLGEIKQSLGRIEGKFNKQ